MMIQKAKWKAPALLLSASAVLSAAALLGGCSPKKSDVDLDLTRMSSTMVYAEVLNLLMDPDAYLGKSIRMAGLFYSYEDQYNGQRYYSCIVEDATACCGQGIDFSLAGDYSYPDDYPVLDAEIEVTGVFDRYEMDDTVFYYVRDAEMERL